MRFHFLNQKIGNWCLSITKKKKKKKKKKKQQVFSRLKGDAKNEIFGPNGPPYVLKY